MAEPEGKVLTEEEKKELGIKTDLDSASDLKVVPVAQGALEDIASESAGSDVNTKTDFTALLIKILQRALDADLNLTTENPEIFKHILSAYSAFSSVIQKCKITPTPDDRYSKIGQEMLVLLAGAKVPMGSKVKVEDQVKALEGLQPQLEAIFSRENLTWIEVKYILEGVFRSLKATEQLYSSNVERSLKRMEAKILGLDDMFDLSMKKLDETLQADMKEAQKPKTE